MRGEGGEALGRTPDGEYDVGDPVAVESIMEPSDDVRAPVVLEDGMPGRSWRGRAAALAEMEAGEAAAVVTDELRQPSIAAGGGSPMTPGMNQVLFPSVGVC